MKRVEFNRINHYFQPLQDELKKTIAIMKNNILKITAASLFAAFVVAAPALSRAQDATTTPAPAAAPAAPAAAPDPATPPPAKPKKQKLVFSGTVSAIDTNAMTLTVETNTYAITSTTKITKDGKPATLGEGVVGEPVSGATKPGTDGKLNATTIHFGAKTTVKKKKGTTAATGVSTNSAGN